MSFMDILQQYASGPKNAPQDAHEHFETVARSAPPNVVGDGIAEALRSDQTPPFGQMIGQLFQHSDPQQKAGVLNQLIAAVGPAMLSRIAGGMFAGAGNAATAAPVSPTQASTVTPAQVEEIANHAEKADPGIADRIGGFYAQHPQVVKALGGMALAIALGRMANRMPH